MKVYLHREVVGQHRRSRPQPFGAARCLTDDRQSRLELTEVLGNLTQVCEGPKWNGHRETEPGDPRCNPHDDPVAGGETRFLGAVHSRPHRLNGDVSKYLP